jgi:Glycosyl transferase 4-like domain/Glycosyl transferases group 1
MLLVMLVDNHHGPDRRVDMEVEMLAEAGVSTRVVAWDRRPEAPAVPQDPADWPGAPVELVRVHVPAPAVGGASSILRAARFGVRVWRARRRLLAGADALMAHDIYLLPIAWALSVRTGLPLVYDAHEEFAPMEAGRYPDWLLGLVTRLETAMARRARLVVVPGQSRVGRWERVGIHPAVVPNMGRRVARLGPVEPAVDLAYCGGLSEKRRLDLLVDVARARPDLRVAIAGEGRSQDWLAAAAAELPNLEFVGETSQPDEFLARSRAVYYGLDPAHPYAAKACPNTIYQAVRVGRPLLSLAVGEADRFLEEFRVGLRIAPDPASLAEAVDRVRAGEDAWEFDAAWERLERERDAGTFARRLREAA